MKSTTSKNKSVREKLEERVKFFLDKQKLRNIKNNIKKLDPINKSNTPTIKDNLIYTEKGKQNIDKNKNNNKNLIHGKNMNISSLSTQNHVTNDIINFSNNKKENQMIPIKKEVIKYMEPRCKLAHFIKLDPKFNKSIELNSLGMSQSFSHEVTKSEIEMMEIDEKLPIKKLEQIESSRIKNMINENFPFHFLMEIEKFYQEISKDLKINKNKNLDYKIKIAAGYLSILKNDENIIYNLFLYNKDINKFLIRELCVFLAVLFLNDFDEIKNTDILDFFYCISYCHLNFIFLIMTIISKTNENIFKNNKIKEEEEKNNNIKEEENNNNNSDFYYKQCKTLIELNSDKIDLINYERNFHNNNKIIKNILLNLLTNLSYNNEKITNIILEIFNLSKSPINSKFRDILNNHIKNNELINEKVNKIIRDSISQENKSNLDDDEDSENLPQPEAPYFPPKSPSDKREYCLVLDLDETLVHFFEDENEAYVKVRLGTENFIRELSKYCEIAIFTASTKYYADIVIDGLDCKDLIDFRLYRQHTTVRDGINVKDLSRLGRDLSKIIIIDNIEDNYQFQKNNGLNICDFEGDENDNELNYLLEDLLKLVSQPGKNVCNELPAIRRNMQKRYTNIS